jgi:negative regulator of flagellin synthesis FlgM
MMKIGNLVDLYGKEALGAKSGAGTPSSIPSSAAQTNTNNNTTTASLSSVASTLAALEPELRAPEFDQAKVEAIKQAMREGKFEVNANAIADKLITSVQELLSRKNAN